LRKNACLLSTTSKIKRNKLHLSITWPISLVAAVIADWLHLIKIAFVFTKRTTRDNTILLNVEFMSNNLSCRSAQKLQKIIRRTAANRILRKLSISVARIIKTWMSKRSSLAKLKDTRINFCKTIDVGDYFLILPC